MEAENILSADTDTADTDTADTESEVETSKKIDLLVVLRNVRLCSLI